MQEFTLTQVTEEKELVFTEAEREEIARCSKLLAVLISEHWCFKPLPETPE
ncbi:hypothetical protein LCGC14_0965090 [marine sediment metagenome]|uniref:Uncharacterized protein n=1 Tax=marine sediment metagenome TaxID=412755 RepID=A0A0F9NHU6_9ZZZZ